MKLHLPILIFMNLIIFSLMSCKESSTIPRQNDYYKYIGTFEGTSLKEYDQQLSYRLSLWRQGDQVCGMIYHQWYVTDTNETEYTSMLEGTLTGKDLYLKGNMSEDFILVGKLEPELIREIDIKYPKNPNRGVKNLQFNICCQELNQVYKELNDFDAIIKYYETDFK